MTIRNTVNDTYVDRKYHRKSRAHTEHSWIDQVKKHTLSFLRPPPPPPPPPLKKPLPALSREIGIGDRGTKCELTTRFLWFGTFARSMACLIATEKRMDNRTKIQSTNERTSCSSLKIREE